MRFLTFLKCPHQFWNPPSNLFSAYRGLFPGLKRPGHEVGHPPPSSLLHKFTLPLLFYCGWTVEWKLVHYITYLLGTLQYSGRHYPQLAVSEKLEEMRNGGCWKFEDNCGRVEWRVLILIPTTWDSLPWDCCDQNYNKIITKYESWIDYNSREMVSWCVRPKVVLLKWDVTVFEVTQWTCSGFGLCDNNCKCHVLVQECNSRKHESMMITMFR
jgi:hypothetical protein